MAPMLAPGDRVVIAGVSVRALAASAARAGYRVTAVDAFGDLDLERVAEVMPLRRGGNTPYAALAAAQRTEAAATGARGIAYTANFENFPEAVARLLRTGQLLGNPPAVLTRVRSPALLMRALARLGFAVPRTRMTVPTSEPFHGWLRKPRRSGGGHDIGRWRRGIPLSRRHYLQQWIDGVPGSLVFVANGRDAMPLGLTRQLAGETALGARRFGYCGSILADPRTPLFDGEDRLRQIAAALAGAVTRAFGLVGLNGIDFIARDGVPYPTEVNPRYSASMELLERAYGVSLFELHLHGCLGRLPRQSPYGEPSAGTHGKAIVFARRDSVMDDTTPWLAEDRADIPHPGDRIGRGKPVCTVFARARDGLACREALLRQAAAVDDQLRRWRTEPSRAWSPA